MVAGVGAQNKSHPISLSSLGTQFWIIPNSQLTGYRALQFHIHAHGALSSASGECSFVRGTWSQGTPLR